MIASSRSLLPVLLGSLLFATPALATTVWGDYSGTTVDFVGVQETTNSADPEPLWEAPTVIGDSLFFSPTNYVSSANGAGGFDQTASLLEWTFEAKGGNIIDVITITEAGDTTLFGALGTAATAALVTLSGVATVVADIGGPIAPVIIPWTATFTQDLFLLPGDLGGTAWVGTANIDIASFVPNATEVIFDMDNVLTTGSEAGTSAFIQKKVNNALAITVPEPTSLALIGLGLVAATLAGRRRAR